MKLSYMTRKSLLYKTAVEYWDWTINHIEWCTHWCLFPCYAMMLAKRFWRIKTYDERREIKIVQNSLELLDIEIPKYKDKIKFVHMCFMTDPFMYDAKKKEVIPEVQEMTLNIIKKLNDNWIKATLLTKWLLPKEIIKMNLSKENEYGITLVSLNEKFRNKFEKYSSSYEDRIASLKKLHDAWLKTWISMEPFPSPALDDSLNDSKWIDKLLESISFVDKIIFGKLNYNVKVTQFKYSGNFYYDMADKVIDFCEKKGIEYHIKQWTQKQYNKKTEKVFVCR